MFSRKRRLVEIAGERNGLDSSPAVNTMKPSESTLLINTGGNAKTADQIYFTSISDVGTSSAIRNADTLIYNDFFWQNAFPTIHQRNCAVGLTVACWNSNPASQKFKRVLMPICLPPFQNLSFASEDENDASVENRS